MKSISVKSVLVFLFFKYFLFHLWPDDDVCAQYDVMKIAIAGWISAIE